MAGSQIASQRRSAKPIPDVGMTAPPSRVRHVNERPRIGSRGTETASEVATPVTTVPYELA